MKYQLLRMVRFSLCSLAWFVLSSPFGNAQQTKDMTSSLRLPVVLPPQLLRFVLMSGITQKASLDNIEGAYSVKSTVQPCWEGGLDYQHTISQSVFYVLGVHVAVTGRSTVFATPAIASNPSAHYEQYPPEKDRQFAPVLAIPLLAEKQMALTPRKSWYANAGVQLNLAISREYSGFGTSVQDSSGQNIQLYDQEVQAYNDGKPWLTGKLGGGMQWVLKNENLLGAGLMANLSFTNFVRGTYEVTLPGEPVTRGNYRANGLYIGVCITYSLAGKFRRQLNGGEAGRR